MTAIKQNRRRTLQIGTALATCIACAGLSQVATAQTLPVVSDPGGATITTPGGNTMRVDLNNANRVIDWTSFSVGGTQGEKVNFVSTNGTTADLATPYAVLNRVTGGTFSNIQGGITSQNNIQVWLANPNGIVFGNGSSFSGGSLVLTTLTTGIDTAFANSNAGANTQLSGTSTAGITINPGVTLSALGGASGTVLMLAQDISNSGKIDATGDVGLFVASDVSFTAGAGSPLSYTINAGTTASFAAPRLRVLGSGSVSGQSVSLVAVTQADAISNLLQTDAGTQISAKSVDGNVYLTAGTGGGALQSTGSQLNVAGALKGGTSTGEVRLTATGNLAAGGTITAGSNVVVTSTAGKASVGANVTAGFDYGVFAQDIALGNGATAVTQSAAHSISVQAPNGAITGDSGLTLRVDTGTSAGLSQLIIDAGNGGTIDFALGSNITGHGTANDSVFVPVGLRYDHSTALKLGNVTGSQIGDFGGVFIGTQLTGASDLTAGTILSEATFNADFTGKIELVGVTTTSPLTNVLLTAGGDLKTTGLLKAPGNVTLDAGGTATVSGSVDAGAGLTGGNYAVRGANVALGSGATAVTQSATGMVTATATAAGGKISGDAGLTLRSNSGDTLALNRLVLDAGTTGSIAFALGSTVAAGSSNNASAAAIGVRFDRTATPGVALSLGSVTGLRLGDYNGLTVGPQLTGVGDFTADAIDTNQAFDAAFTGSIKAASITTRNAGADVTLSAGGSIGGNLVTSQALSVTAAQDIQLTAGTDIALGTVRGRNLAVDAGSNDFAPRQDGSVSLADADVTGNITLYAWGSAAKGEIRVGRAVADGTLTLDNTRDGGLAGSIKVADSLESAGLLTLRSTQDILVAGYNGSGTTGTVTSTNGAIDARADGSVLGYKVGGDTALGAFAIIQAGVGGYSAAGNLDVTTNGQYDLAIGSLQAGGSLTVTSGGNLYGRVQTTTAVNGGFFKAAGTVGVTGDAAAGIINLNRVESVNNAAVTLAASQIAVGTLVTQGNATLTGGTTYVGLRRFPDVGGNVSLTLQTPYTAVPLVNTGNFYAVSANLDGGTSLSASVAGAAQIGTASSGGNIVINAGGLVAGTVTSGSNALLSSAPGTLAVGTATAARSLALRKQGGSTGTAGDELRFGALSGGLGGNDGFSGDVQAFSQTGVRGDTITATGGNAIVRSGYDQATDSLTQPGAIGGLTGTKMQVIATSLPDVDPDGQISTSSGGTSTFGLLLADDDISVVAGTTTAPQNGAVRLDTAQAGGGIYIVNRNAAAGSTSGIGFGTLRAGRDVTLITSTGNGGDAFGGLIDANGSVRASVNDILVDTIQSRSTVQLQANSGRIAKLNGVDGIDITATGTIAAYSGLEMRVGLADSSTGDVSLRSDADLIATTLRAGDDIDLQAVNVRLGSAVSSGLGSDGSDTVLNGTEDIESPYLPGFTAPVPRIYAGSFSPGSNIVIRATGGDVTGLSTAASPAVPIPTITTGDALSADYGRADLTAQARAARINVTAVGSVQLGTVLQGTNAAGTDFGSIFVEGTGVSVDSATANFGSTQLSATSGTLVAGTVSASDTVTLQKNGDAAIAGNEIRFNAVNGGQNGTDSSRLIVTDGAATGARINSATNVLGNSVRTAIGAINVTARGGAVDGRTVPAMTIETPNTAEPLGITVRSATAIDLANVLAGGRISIIAGLLGQQAGSLNVVDAKSLAGSVYLTAVNNVAASANAIGYNTLVAAGEVVAITSGTNRGDVNHISTIAAPWAIDAGTSVAVDALNMDLGAVRAQTGSIALRATGTIGADVLQAQTSVAGLAGSAIGVGSGIANAGDFALQAGGILTIGSATGSDDVQLTGSSVRVGSANTLGGVEVADPDVTALAAVRDPASDGVTGFVPVVSGGVADTDASKITIVATNGDVSGVAVNPLVTPALPTVTTDAQLSTAYGKANLTALDGGISVTADNGSVQLGTALLDYSFDGIGFSPLQAITVDAKAISGDTFTANYGDINLDASLGTLVIDKAEAFSGVLSLIKRNGDAGVDGDELRVLTRGSAATVTLTSSTHVRAADLGSGFGDITVTAQGGDISGIKTGTAALIPLPTVTTGADLTDVYGRLNIGGVGNNATIALNATGSVQLGDIVQNNVFPYSFPAGTGSIQIAGEAVSARSLNANSGAIDVVARSGTLVLGTAVARGAISLSKAGGTLAQAGNEVRFTSLTGGGSASASSRDITVLSQTNIRGDSVSTPSGNVTLRAGYDAGAAATTLAGQITGLGFTTATPNAMNVTAGTPVGSTRLLATAGGRVQFGALLAGDDISIVAGDTATPSNGAIRIATAQAGGDIFLTNKNTVAGSDAGIGFSSLVAGGDAVLITSTGNGGDASGALIQANNVKVSVNDILVGTITARGDVALQANVDGLVDSNAITANGGIAIDAATSVRLGAVEARLTDVAVRAGTSILAGTVTAADDVSLAGTSVTADTIVAKGTGNDATDVVFGGGSLAANPYDAGFSAPIPTVNGAKAAANTGGTIAVNATAGSIAVNTSATAQNSALFSARDDVAIKSGTVTAGSLGILAGRDVVSATSLTAGEDLAIQSGGAVSLLAATAGDDFTVSAPGTITVDSATITGLGSGATDVAFTPALSVGAASLPANTVRLTSGSGNVSVGALSVQAPAADATVEFSAAAGTITLARDVAVQGGLTIRAGQDVTLGDDQARTQTATGLIDIASSGGAIKQGSGRLALGANSDGAGTEALTLNAATDVALGATDLTGGTARQSAIDLAAQSGAIAIGTANGVTFTAAAGTGFTANGAIVAGNAARGPDVASPTISIVASQGNIVATTIDATDAGHDANLQASFAVTLDRLTAARSVNVSAGSTLTANAVTATSGTLGIGTGTDIRVGSTTSGTDTSLFAGAGVYVGKSVAGGTTTVNGFGGVDLTEVQSGGAASVTSRGSVAIGTLTTGGTLTVNATNDATLGTLTAAGDTDIKTGGAVLQLTRLDTQGNLDLGTGAGATLGTLTVKNAAQINTAGALSLNQLTSGGAARLTTASGATIGTLSSGGNVTVTVARSATIGTLASGGAASIGVGDALRLDKLTSGATTGLSAGTDVTLGTLTSVGNVTVNAGGAITQLASLDTQGSATLTAGSNANLGSIKARGAAQVTTRTGAVTIGDLTSGAAATVTAATNLGFGSISSGGAAALTAGGAVTGTSLNAGGAASVGSGTAVRVDRLTSGATTGITAGTDATLGTLTSVGNVTVNAGGAITQLTGLDTQGTATITAGSNASLGSIKARGAAQVTTRTGAVTIGDLTSGPAATVTAATNLGFGSISASGAAALTAGGAVTGTSLSAGGATTVGSGTATRIDRLTSGAATTIRTGTDATFGTVTSAGDASVTAKGLITLSGAFNAAGRNVTLTGKDAAIGADVTAATIKVVDDAAAGNALVLGDGATGTGFALSDAEVGRLKASSTLVLDAASAANRQDVSIGKLTLAGPAKVLVLANGTRIDVTGKIDVSGATTNLQLGGSGEEAGLASVLRVAAKADGTGGSIAAPAANVSLRAANIAFGQDAGFLSAIGVTGTGTGDAATALVYNNRASSTLYYAGTAGGAIYTPSLAGVKLLTANTLTLTYTDFALIQNTGLQGQTTGTEIGTFLTVNASGVRPVLGLFGTIAGRQGTAAALLGNLGFKINLNDISSARVNGCIVGEGAGCISTLVFSPNLAAIDAVRPTLFTVASDYEVPFNPLIGTNNDALFGDVGTYGLEDIPLEPIECSDPNNAQCPTQKKGAN